LGRGKIRRSKIAQCNTIGVFRESKPCGIQKTFTKKTKDKSATSTTARAAKKEEKKGVARLKLDLHQGGGKKRRKEATPDQPMAPRRKKGRKKGQFLMALRWEKSQNTRGWATISHLHEEGGGRKRKKKKLDKTQANITLGFPKLTKGEKGAINNAGGAVQKFQLKKGRTEKACGGGGGTETETKKAKNYNGPNAQKHSTKKLRASRKEER